MTWVLTIGLFFISNHFFALTALANDNGGGPYIPLL